MSEEAVSISTGARRRMNGIEKAAALLMFLGEDLATEVFRGLQEDEIRLIVSAIPKLGDITPDEMQKVLDEFSQRLTAEGYMSKSGKDFIESVVHGAMAHDKAQSVLQRLEVEQQLEQIRRYDPRAIFNLIKKEHPQTIAFILSQLPAHTTADIVANLPEDMQFEVMRRIARMDSVLPGALEEVVEALGRELSTFAIDVAETSGGIKPAAEILNSMKKSGANEIMRKLVEEDPDLAEQIGQHMFVFEDLLNVDDRGIQMILKEVGNDDLAVALKMASEEVKMKIFKNISSRAGEMIQEDMEARGPVRISDVEKAQGVIVRVARRLEQEGKIVVSGRGGEDMFV
ncbi:MAG: flagellar motor switch protein FliG [Candidatus Lernaella stagnicola]|nr:flagellar motor switch protein FliG [Candidatus Lernaella stagnicola]